MTLKEVYRLCGPVGTTCPYPHDQWQQLSEAIVEKAVIDYCNALAGRGYRNRSASAVKAECERFFRSKWFTTLSPLDGETVIQRLSTGCVQKQEGECDDER